MRWKRKNCLSSVISIWGSAIIQSKNEISAIIINIIIIFLTLGTLNPEG